MKTRVKICGIRRVDELREAVTAGADAIGFVFHSASPRAVSIAEAVELSASVPPFVSRVALFMDANESVVRSVIDAVNPDLVQFHGVESHAFCEQFGRPYLKSVGMKNNPLSIADAVSAYPSAQGLLLDGHAPGEAGGSGKRFAWFDLRTVGKPIVLAGGLTPDNVAEAIRIAGPYAVDVSSGVESSPGVKSAELIRTFMAAVRKENL